MYFGGIRNGYSDATPSLPPFFSPHIQQIEEFRSTCHQLTIKLLKCFAISFGLEPNYFADGMECLDDSDSRTQGYRIARRAIEITSLSSQNGTSAAGNHSPNPPYRLSFGYASVPKESRSRCVVSERRVDTRAGFR
jgi:isopenicillin N synthase-like dioxygenase